MLNKEDFDFYARDLLIDEKIIILNKNLKEINSLLIDILGNDYNYYHCFTLLIYNLKEYLIKKEGRKRAKKNEVQKIDIMNS